MKAKPAPDAIRRMLDSVKVLLRAGDTLARATEYLTAIWAGDDANVQARAILLAAQRELLNDAKLVLGSLQGWVQ